MIQTVWPYLAVMLLAAGIYPTLERRTGWKLFAVFPPIVLVYLSVTALAVIGLWQVTPDIQAAQKLLIAQLIPALLFLLMVNCDLRAIFALGPRVLAVFFCTSIALFVAFVATLLASGTGTLLALLAAATGRWTDSVLSRVLDTLTAIPSKMFALLMVASFGSSVFMLIVSAAIIYLPGAFRIARSLAVNINALDYVTVARTRGEKTRYVMLYEILPNITGPMMADFGLRFVYVVLLLASLSFLGLGIQPPEADWGSLVRENIEVLAEGGAAVIAPSIAIASLTIAVNLVIDNLPGRAARERGGR